jgi:hypothetical protein
MSDTPRKTLKLSGTMRTIPIEPPARSSEEYFADRDAFVAYVLEEVNPARNAEGLDTCSAGLAGHLFQVMSEHRHRP